MVTNLLTWDFPNWIAIIIELAIAIPFAIYLYKRQGTLQNVQTDILKQLNDIVRKENDRQKRRKTYFCTHIIKSLELIKGDHIKLEELIADFIKDRSHQNKDRIISYSRTIGEINEHYRIPWIQRNLEDVADLLNDPQLAVTISELCNTFATMFKDMLQEFVWKEDYNLHNKIAVIEGMVITIEKLKSKLHTEIVE